MSETQPMGLGELCVWLLGEGLTLHAHGDRLCVQGGLAGHLHRLGEPDCHHGDCAYFGDNARVLVAHAPVLWRLLDLEPCCAFTYDVDTVTWHPEWVGVDEDGRPYVEASP